jgi:hypothetical protein
MLMLCDVWEGALDIDELVLRNGGVVGLMVRINDMNGGHHMDTNFYNQWSQAELFLRAPYFVYNPWVDGVANFNWLSAHVPAETTIVFPDIEVSKPEYPKETYADEVDEFIQLTRARWRAPIYTGGWFLGTIAHWPGGDYWWGRYPYYLCPRGDRVTWTWEEMQQRANTYGWNPDPTKQCPGVVRVWQCSGDKVILPGTAGRAMDINLWPTTLPALEEFWGMRLPGAKTMDERVTKLEEQARLHGWDI